MSNCLFNLDMTVAVVASSGSNGQFNFLTSVDTMYFQLGIVTLTEWWSLLMSIKSAFNITKCPMAPESKII